jgi:hypothetical protein
MDSGELLAAAIAVVDRSPAGRNGVLAMGCCPPYSKLERTKREPYIFTSSGVHQRMAIGFPIDPVAPTIGNGT